MPGNGHAPRDAIGSDAGGWGEDVLERARRTIVKLMDGNLGRNAMVQLAAAKTILAKDFLAELPDEQLMAEVERRIGVRAAGQGGGGNGKPRTSA